MPDSLRTAFELAQKEGLLHPRQKYDQAIDKLLKVGYLLHISSECAMRGE